MFRSLWSRGWPPRIAVNSITFRFLAGASIALLIALVVAGLLFSSLYREWREREVDNIIRSKIDSVVLGFDVDRPRRSEIASNFKQQPYSNRFTGAYWMVVRRNDKDQSDTLQLWSASLGEPNNPSPDVLPVETGKLRVYHNYEAQGPFGKRLRLISYKVNLADKKMPYVVIASWPLDPLEDEVDSFGVALVITLGILALILLVALGIVIRYGLNPLRKVAPDLASIRSGKSERLTGPFPVEIAPLADEVNALLTHNAQVVDRARTHAGNLAHALKTPLAVLQNEAGASPSPLSDKVVAQTRIMKDSVEHHLARARMAAQAGVLGARTDVMPIIEGLARTLEKIHRDKDLTIDASGPPDAAFRGEKQDFEEALGNLMDNACRFARSAVRVTATLDKGERQAMLIVTVEDDGAGLSQSQRRTAVKRGARLDEQTPGSGLGLSIVRDVAEMYDGAFDLDESDLGGLAARMTLPAAG